jgi:hypothetical protein
MPARAPLPILASVCLFTLLANSCSQSAPERKTAIFEAGDKAHVGNLTYSVVDTRILPRLGSEASPRLPRNRFYIVQISVLNSGNADEAIPGMTLIDDAGKKYDELPDGSGVPQWLGVVRRVPANQVEQGNMVFDAPASHYKLKLTDETDASDVFVDLPLSFAHEQLENETGTNPDAATQESAPNTTIIRNVPAGVGNVPVGKK